MWRCSIFETGHYLSTGIPVSFDQFKPETCHRLAAIVGEAGTFSQTKQRPILKENNVRLGKSA
jgi:hypothetical protein